MSKSRRCTYYHTNLTPVPSSIKVITEGKQYYIENDDGTRSQVFTSTKVARRNRFVFDDEAMTDVPSNRKVIERKRHYYLTEIVDGAEIETTEVYRYRSLVLIREKEAKGIQRRSVKTLERKKLKYVYADDEGNFQNVTEEMSVTTVRRKHFVMVEGKKREAFLRKKLKSREFVYEDNEQPVEQSIKPVKHGRKYFVGERLVVRKSALEKRKQTQDKNKSANKNKRKKVAKETVYMYRNENNEDCTVPNDVTVKTYKKKHYINLDGRQIQVFAEDNYLYRRVFVDETDTPLDNQDGVVKEGNKYYDDKKRVRRRAAHKLREREIKKATKEVLGKRKKPEKNDASNEENDDNIMLSNGASKRKTARISKTRALKRFRQLPEANESKSDIESEHDAHPFNDETYTEKAREVDTLLSSPNFSDNESELVIDEIYDEENEDCASLITTPQAEVDAARIESIINESGQGYFSEEKCMEKEKDEEEKVRELDTSLSSPNHSEDEDEINEALECSNDPQQLLYNLIMDEESEDEIDEEVEDMKVDEKSEDEIDEEVEEDAEVEDEEDEYASSVVKDDNRMFQSNMTNAQNLFTLFYNPTAPLPAISKKERQEFIELNPYLSKPKGN